MKKLLSFILAVLMITALVACGSQAAAAQFKFGYVVNDMSHEWYQNIVKGARIRAGELGAELMVADSAMDAGRQITQLENMLADGVDVLIITPVDVRGLAAIMSRRAKWACRS